MTISRRFADAEPRRLGGDEVGRVAAGAPPRTSPSESGAALAAEAAAAAPASRRRSRAACWKMSRAISERTTARRSATSHTSHDDLSTSSHARNWRERWRSRTFRRRLGSSLSKGVGGTRSFWERGRALSMTRRALGHRVPNVGSDALWVAGLSIRIAAAAASAIVATAADEPRGLGRSIGSDKLRGDAGVSAGGAARGVDGADPERERRLPTYASARACAAGAACPTAPRIRRDDRVGEVGARGGRAETGLLRVGAIEPAMNGSRFNRFVGEEHGRPRLRGTLPFAANPDAEG